MLVVDAAMSIPKLFGRELQPVADPIAENLRFWKL